MENYCGKSICIASHPPAKTTIIIIIVHSACYQNERGVRAVLRKPQRAQTRDCSLCWVSGGTNQNVARLATVVSAVLWCVGKTQRDVTRRSRIVRLLSVKHRGVNHRRISLRCFGTAEVSWHHHFDCDSCFRKQLSRGGKLACGAKYLSSQIG